MALGSKYFRKMSVIDAEQGPEYVGNNAKSWILKRVSQKKESTPHFRKNERFLHPDTHTHVCVSGGKKCSVLQNLACFVFFVTPV